MLIVVWCALRITSNVIFMTVWVIGMVTELYRARNDVVERHLPQPRSNKLSLIYRFGKIIKLFNVSII